MNKNTPILYKIYYGDVLVYLGRTNQPLQTRLRGHFFKKPMHRVLDINLVTKIEYAEFKTVADMYLYEIYYINQLKPGFNVDDRARDEITVSLPEIPFKEFECPLMEKWKKQLTEQTTKHTKLYAEYLEIPQRISILRRKFRDGEIDEAAYWAAKDALYERRKELETELYR